MCVYEGYNKARDCRQETLVKYEVHRYMNTNEWINAAALKVIYMRQQLELVHVCWFVLH